MNKRLEFNNSRAALAGATSSNSLIEDYNKQSLESFKTDEDFEEEQKPRLLSKFKNEP